MTRWRGAWLIACVGCFAAGFYSAGGSRLLNVVVSPDGRERLEEYSPPRWRSLTVGNRELPAYLRLTDRASGMPIGHDSPIVDLEDAGAPIWETGSVSLGVLARFDRSTGRWTSYEALAHR